MHYYDETQEVLYKHLMETKVIFERLLYEKFGDGCVKIITSFDLGFPHDVIRLAGGFATGAYVYWESNKPIVPVDTCVNDCAVTFFEINKDIRYMFSKEYLSEFELRMKETIYQLNFHRGNHFMLFVQSLMTGKMYLVLHSSANEFKDNYNGLYPTETNYVHECIKIYRSNGRYIRYVDENAAELFCRISLQLPAFNEARHEFIASTFLNHNATILNATTSHHYCMPTCNSVTMGGHVSKSGMIFPFLTIPGENIFTIKYLSTKDIDLNLPYDGEFLTPHGLGKQDTIRPQIEIDIKHNICRLGGFTYNIKWGESLRSHATLKLRDFERDRVFNFLKLIYDYEITDEFVQLASYNKSGSIIWNTDSL